MLNAHCDRPSHKQNIELLEHYQLTRGRLSHCIKYISVKYKSNRSTGIGLSVCKTTNLSHQSRAETVDCIVFFHRRTQHKNNIFHREMLQPEEWCDMCHSDLPRHQHQQDGSCRVLCSHGVVVHKFAGLEKMVKPGEQYFSSV